MKRPLFALLFSLLLAAQAVATDLYKVTVRDQVDAQKLATLATETLLAIRGGYLVLAESAAATQLEQSGLDVRLLAKDASRNELALDHRLDQSNAGRYALLYQEDQLRLFRVDPSLLTHPTETTGLIAVPRLPIPIRYHPAPERALISADLTRLRGVVEQVRQDSLYNYVWQLQAFYRRVAGTANIYDARDTIVQRFHRFGYDSVSLDGFDFQTGGGTKAGYNVVAKKVGTLYPDYQIIVCAHYDGVSNSPAADDNGSGTAGVLELARVMKDSALNVTVLFITFDAEETGLDGSFHYAEEAAARGDKILVVFNMDMIAHQTNNTQANLFHGSDTYYGQVWINIAQPLVGITGFLAGSSGGSDHYPFTQVGYDGIFLAERNFSTVYHSPNDSTTHMNFEYMTRMVRATAAWLMTTANSNDFDGDGIPNASDNCIFVANSSQIDADGDSLGNICDNCPYVYNPLQEDENHNGTGDHCDGELHIISYQIPDGYKGKPFSYQMQAVGGLEPYSWSFIGGDLPYGLTFTGGSTATITGTPTWKATYYFTIAVADAGAPTKVDTLGCSIRITDPPPPPYVCGDADASGAVDVSDPVHLIAYIFSGGPAPNPLGRGDVDCSGTVDISDAVYLIAYIFSGGPVPCLGC